jgi:hypothetical protein
MTTLATLSLASLVALHNNAIVEFGAPEGFGEVAKFNSKAKAVAAIEALCEAGNMAVSFEGDSAVIIDASEAADDAPEAAEIVALGDGKGKVRAWGVALGSDEWLKANPRGTEAREAYRKERRKAARVARTDARKAKEAAREAANA